MYCLRWVIHKWNVSCCSSLSLPKFVFILRTCPPSFFKDAITSLDTPLYASVSEIVGTPLSDCAWQKATLPVSLRCLGFCLASLMLQQLSSVLCASCCWDFVSKSSPSPHSSDALLLLASVVDRPDWASIEDIDVPVHQHHPIWAINQARFESFVQKAPDVFSRALALSSSIRHAGDWLFMCSWIFSTLNILEAVMIMI